MRAVNFMSLPRKNPCYSLQIWSWLGPRDRQDILEKTKSPIADGICRKYLYQQFAISRNQNVSLRKLHSQFFNSRLNFLSNTFPRRSVIYFSWYGQMSQINRSCSYSVVSVFQSNSKDLPTWYTTHLIFPSSPGKCCYSTRCVQHTVYVG